ncbi:DUF3304 domain-containing protein [Vogesella facilis]|uniref:DUF3304 domain-containing protein n=1 Tax=Vogesella facilis TaxID=1655232 RepID=A0ABV7R9Q8_9NEIS
MKQWMQGLLGLSLMWLLAACDPVVVGDAGRKAAGEKGGVAVSVDAVNYMHDWDVQYTLYDVRNNEPVGGAIVSALEGPGGKGCCVSLPATWQPGIKLRVEWEEGNKELTKPEKFSRVVELPRYEQPGDVYVLFYPNQEVEARVSDVEPGNPGWAGRIKLPAWPACVQQLGEKECRKLQPKYAIGSDERWAAEYRAACQPDKVVTPEQKRANGGGGWTKAGCEKIRQECLSEWQLDKRMCDIDFKDE